MEEVRSDLDSGAQDVESYRSASDADDLPGKVSGGIGYPAGA